MAKRALREDDRPGMTILDKDAVITRMEMHPSGHNAWEGDVETTVEDDIDLTQEFQTPSCMANYCFGTRSSLAQLGIFAKLKNDSRTKEPMIEINPESIRATVRVGSYKSLNVDVKVGKQFGRFFNIHGSRLARDEVLQLLEQTKHEGKPLFDGDDQMVSPQGGIVLSADNIELAVDPETEHPQPYNLDGGRPDLEGLLVPREVDPKRLVERDDFIVTQSKEAVRIPDGYAGILECDQYGGTSPLVHLNSPIVDERFNDKLILEMHHTNAFPILWREITAEMFIYKTRVLGNGD